MDSARRRPVQEAAHESSLLKSIRSLKSLGNQTMKLKDHVAIVTGAGRGIGVALALGLAREGAAVVVNYSRSAAEANKVVGDIVAAGGRAVAIQADIMDLAHHDRLVATALDHFGRLDILINNAGIEFREPFL